MRKSELRTGMCVLMGSGAYGLVMGNTIISLCNKRHSGGASLSSYSDDLLYCNNVNNSWSILKVYAEKKDLSGGDIKSKTTDTVSIESYLLGMRIWKREDIKELTIEELEATLGYKIKIIGGY